jgi:hypothetical protein
VTPPSPRPPAALDLPVVLASAELDRWTEAWERTLVFVHDTAFPAFALDAATVTMIGRVPSPVLFRTQAHLARFADLAGGSPDPAWSAINHVAGADDDDTFGFLQDRGRQIALRLELPKYGDLAEDLEPMRETIALASADECAGVVRSLRAALDAADRHGSRAVLVVGAALFSLCLVDLLRANGVPATLLAQDCQPGVHALQAALISNRFAETIHVRGRNVSVRERVAGLVAALEGTDAAAVVRLADPIYLSNFAEVCRQAAGRKVTVIDNLSWATDQGIVEPLLGGAALADLGPVNSGFSRKIARYVAAQLAVATQAEAGRDSAVAGLALTDALLHLHGDVLLRSALRCMTLHRIFRLVFAAVTPPLGLIVSPTRRVEGRAAAVAAAAAGMPVTDLTCSALLRSRRFWKPPADRVFCADAETYRIYTEFLGMEADRVVLVGSPRLDAEIAPFRTERKHRPGTRRLFLALQPLPLSTTLATVSAVVEAVSTVGGHEIRVGFHPRESEAGRQAVLDLLAATRVPWGVHEGPSLAGAAESDVCVTFFSFFGVEAFALGCSVVALNVTGGAWPFRLSAVGIAREATSAGDLATVLRDLAQGSEAPGRPAADADPLNERTRDVLRRGGSAVRIWSEIERVAAEKTVRRPPAPPEVEQRVVCTPVTEAAPSMAARIGALVRRGLRRRTV